MHHAEKVTSEYTFNKDENHKRGGGYRIKEITKPSHNKREIPE